MADSDRHPAWEQIEAAAGEGHRIHHDFRPGEHEIELSKAISLKRIADALWGDDRNSGIIRLLADIEMNGRAN